MINSQASNRHHILLVEDDELSQRLFCILFDRLGCNIDVASNGADGVEAVKNGNYDMVFMDIRMPIMDGLEATRRIRALKGDSKNVPIIAITASDLQGEERLSLAAGMNSHVHKPFDVKRIQQILDEFEGGKFGKPSLGGEEDFPKNKQYMGEFLQGLPNKIRALEDALQNKEWHKLGIDAHNLKGLAAFFGAMKLSNLAGQLDRLAEEQSFDEAGEILGEIKDASSSLVDRRFGIVSNENG